MTKLNKALFGDEFNKSYIILAGIILLLIILSFIVIMPILFAISISFQTRAQVFTYPPSFIPDKLYFGNYVRAWNLVNMGRLLTNSLIASVIVMIGKLTLGVLSGYAFSHFKFKGKKFLFFAILFTLMLPMQVRVVPLFEFVSNFNNPHFNNVTRLSVFAIVTGAIGILSIVGRYLLAVRHDR